MACAGMVLCGGASRRMGQDKAWLDFRGEPLLCRVVRIVGEAVGPVVVVAGPNQALPILGDNVVIAHDVAQHQGPLHGLTAGLVRIAATHEQVFVAPCDAPLLTAELIRFMMAQAKPGRAVVANLHGRRIPLPAVYPTDARTTLQRLLQSGQSSLQALLQAIAVDELGEKQFATVDPTLAAFRSMNDLEEYHAAVAEAESQRHLPPH